MYPRRLKAEAFSNAVDVVERLRDPTDPSTERTAPPRSAHIQLDEVPTHQNHNDFSSVFCFNLQQGPAVVKLDSTKVG